MTSAITHCKNNLQANDLNHQTLIIRRNYSFDKTHNIIKVEFRAGNVVSNYHDISREAALCREGAVPGRSFVCKPVIM